ncbi:MAG: hypothetical protein ABIR79_10960 [Candidatus Binatia bacterium]
MKRALVIIGSGAAAALLVAAAAATNPPGAPADHFLSYKTKATKGAPAFAPIVNVRLTDRFEDAVSFDAIVSDRHRVNGEDRPARMPRRSSR